jgi:hypothetical protein
MTDLKSVLAYICKMYPRPDDLSRTRLTKLVYLADWKSAIDRGRTITSIRWYFDNFGPFVWDVWNAADADKGTFAIEMTSTPFGDPKHVIKIREGASIDGLDEADRQILDYVIDATKELSWQPFIRLVYSTYPVLSSERYSSLDLVEKAKQYEQHKAVNAPGD